MKISVVIPCYNSEAFIEKALVSVCQQTYRKFELIISDDGSTDNTLQKVRNILNKYPDVEYKILENEHYGVSRTRNLGILAARYDWIAFLDSDDYWLKDKLEQVVIAINSTQANLVFHNEMFFQENNEDQYPVNYVSRYNPDIHPFLALFRKNFLSPSSLVVSKSLLDKAGLFNEELDYAEDYDLWLRISLLPEIKIYGINKNLTYYVVRSGSLTSNTKKRLHGLLKILDYHRDNVLRLSDMGKLELYRFKGIAYRRCGWAYFKSGNMLGVFYILKGLYLSSLLSFESDSS